MLSKNNKACLKDFAHGEIFTTIFECLLLNLFVCLNDEWATLSGHALSILGHGTTRFGVQRCLEKTEKTLWQFWGMRNFLVAVSLAQRKEIMLTIMIIWSYGAVPLHWEVSNIGSLSCKTTNFMGYRLLVVLCLPLADLHHFCLTKQFPKTPSAI